MEYREISAQEAKNLTNEAPLRRLNATKEQIMGVIYENAQEGYNHARIHMAYYDELLCLEDWNNIYNWLLKLGYDVEDNTGSKFFNPHFYIKW